MIESIAVRATICAVGLAVLCWEAVAASAGRVLDAYIACQSESFITRITLLSRVGSTVTIVNSSTVVAITFVDLANLCETIEMVIGIARRAMNAAISGTVAIVNCNTMIAATRILLASVVCQVERVVTVAMCALVTTI